MSSKRVKKKHSMPKPLVIDTEQAAIVFRAGPTADSLIYEIQYHDGVRDPKFEIRFIHATLPRLLSAKPKPRGRYRYA